MKQRFVTAARQARIEEYLGAGQYHRAVAVVLHLPVGIVANAYRPHAAIASKRINCGFVQLLFLCDAEHRLEITVL